jgi:phosphate transport system substrate-binding protein
MQPLIQDLAEAYAARRDYVTIEVEGGGSDLGRQAVREGGADMGLIARELSWDEEGDLEATLIARDAVAVVVNEARDVEILSLVQVRSIFAGELLEWVEVGGQAGDFVPLVQDEGSEVRALFEARVMAGGRVTPRAVVVLGDEGVAHFVAQERGAIGYLSVGSLGPGAKALALDGVLPEPETISQGTYPLVRPFFLVTRPAPGQEVRAFIEFVLSPEGQTIVGRRYVRVR